MKEQLFKSFRIAVIGSVICLVASVVDVFYAFNDKEFLSTVGDFLLIAGAVVWGIGLIGAGQILCKNGQLETGVTTAGGALIFWAITLMLFQLFVDIENIKFSNVSFYIWFAITLIGPAIFYLSFKQSEEKEDKFFGMASNGMSIIIICEIAFLAIILLGLWIADGNGVSIKTAGDYIMVKENKFHALGRWIFEHYTLVSGIIAIVSALGYLICTLSMASYKEALADFEVEFEDSKNENVIEG